MVDPLGYYEFSSAAQVGLPLFVDDTFFIAEVIQPGWAQTFPAAPNPVPDATGSNFWGPVTITEDVPQVSGDAGQAELPNFGNVQQQATKTGIKYEDFNANGVFDVGVDQPLAGWTIAAFADNDGSSTLSAGDTFVTSDVTLADGSYTLSLTAGAYIIVEQVSNQPGWFESPDIDTTLVNDSAGMAFNPIYGEYGYAIVLAGGDVETGNDFANYQNAVKRGTKYHDLNADGDFDPGEPGLPGWTIQAYTAGVDGTFGTGDDVLVSSDVTDANGDYELQLMPGTYQFREVLQAGWIASSGPITETLTSGEVSEDNDFFNYQNAVKRGTKYHDLNADGDFDPGEPGLPGWTIQAYTAGVDGTFGTGDDVLVSSDVTDANGDYELQLMPGTYQFREVLQAGWIASSGPITETLTSGEVSEDNDFFNYQNAVKRGTKYHDLNKDGTFNGSDSLLDGWMITAYLDNGMTAGVLDAGDTFVQTVLTGHTGNTGEYEFSLKPGNYIIVEEDRAGWFQSQPATDVNGGVNGHAENGYAITLTSGQEDTNNDFGNFRRELIIIGNDKGSTPTVTVLDVSDPNNPVVVFQFDAYESSFNGGVRLVTADLDGDGFQEIVTAPGLGREMEIRVFDTADGVTWTLAPVFAFSTYGAAFAGGAQIAVGEFNGDGKPDLVVTPSSGVQPTQIFLNTTTQVGQPQFDTTPFKSFLAFGPSFTGGSVVATGNMDSDPGMIDEVIVGTGRGIDGRVVVWNVTGAPTPTLEFAPFGGGFRGGLSLDVGLVNGDDIPDLIIGAGYRGKSAVEVWDGTDPTNGLLVSFKAFTGSSASAPVHVAGQDLDGDGVLDRILATQGPLGQTNDVVAFNLSTSTLFMLADLDLLNDPLLQGAYFIDVL